MGRGRFDFSVDARDGVVAIDISKFPRSMGLPITSVAHLRITGAACSASAQLNAEPSILRPD